MTGRRSSCAGSGATPSSSSGSSPGPCSPSGASTSTEDFGDIVFNLVEAGLLSRSEHDTREDFRGVYDFNDAFERDFRRSLDDVTLGV